jgi:hypothetical protein
MQLLRTRLGLPGHNNLRWLGWVAVIGLVLVALLAPASPALSNDTPGNNGTVKIHEGAGEPEPSEVRNEPHVCTFHLHFYFSDPEQASTWEIQEWSPGDKGTVVLSGTYDTQGDGEDRQPEEGAYTLPDGHYKLFWDGDLDTQKHDKMKVFWVECEETTTTSTSETTSVGGTTETTSSSESTTSSQSTETTTSGETTVSGTTTGETTSSGTTTSETTTGETSVSGTTTAETTTGETTTGETTTGESTTTTTEFSQTVSGITTSAAGPTLPNTATVSEGPTGSPGSPVSLLAAVLAFLVGSVLLLTPDRPKKRE